MSAASVSLPTTIFNAAQVRVMDRYAIDQLGIPSYTLMSRAGIAAWECLHAQWPAAQHIVVICGSGNNAGDGYVLARMALRADIQVTALALSEPDQLQDDAQRAWQDFSALGGQVQSWSEAVLDTADVIVDAIFGIGLSRPLDSRLCSIVSAINNAAAPKLALDIPSGLQADTGKVLGAAIKADCTITFIALKIGCYVGEGPDYAGSIAFSDLAVPLPAECQAAVIATRIDPPWLHSLLTPRRRTSNKGTHGRVLIIGGSQGMGGAARLAGEACLRVGAGLVTLATHPDNVAATVASRPELIVRGINAIAELTALIDQADVIAIGPGLGTNAWSKEIYSAALAHVSDKPWILDADALNLLSGAPQRRTNWILTPHPGEAARLLAVTNSDIQANRIDSATTIAEQFGGVVVLKGAGSTVATHGELPAICDRGNPGLATAGTGDVLTGVIAGLAAQFGANDDSLPRNWRAAKAGVLVHALAGDLAASHGERGLIASDVIERLRACVNPC